MKRACRVSFPGYSRKKTCGRVRLTDFFTDFEKNRLFLQSIRILDQDNSVFEDLRFCRFRQNLISPLFSKYPVIWGRYRKSLFLIFFFSVNVLGRNAKKTTHQSRSCPLMNTINKVNFSCYMVFNVN